MMKRNIIIILVIALLVTLVSCSGKDRELTAKVDSLTKTVTTLNEENRKLKARFDALETTAKNLTTQINGVEESLLFDVPDYPVRYQLTEKSYADYKAQLVDLMKNSAGVTGVTDEELNEALMMLEYIEESTFMDEFLQDASYIELVDKETVILDGDSAFYYIEDGELYVYGEKLGLIDEEAITIVEEDDGITLAFKFYRTSPRSGGRMTIGDKFELIEKKIDELYSGYNY